MKKIIRPIFQLIFVFLIGLTALPGAHAQSFEVEKAIAAGDHKGLAEYYKSQADTQRKMAELHRKMKTEYRRTHVHYKGIENVLAGHCGNLSHEALQMAEQYDALAKGEEKLAATGK